MGLYISYGVGRKAIPWIPGDPGLPTQADSIEEVRALCPRPNPLPCPKSACDCMRFVVPHGSRGRWQWVHMSLCRRCQDLRNHHGLELVELIAIWEAQDRRCYRCSKMLPDPRIIITGVRGKGREAKIDHDHRICPQACHSCERCRRGLACTACNCHELAISARVGLWVIPEEDKSLDSWLEFLGSTDRDRLRKALAHFPDQPACKISCDEETLRRALGIMLLDPVAYRASA
jgi:hypothetical protein